MAIDDPETGVIPSLTVSPCAEAIDFYVAAFGAEEIEPRMDGPDGTVYHAEIVIEGARIMLGDPMDIAPTDAPSSLGGSTAALFIYTDDVEALWDRAVAAGAEEVFPLEDQFYGDRGGRLRDPFGHTWGLGQHMEDLTDEEMQRRMAEWTDDNA